MTDRLLEARSRPRPGAARRSSSTATSTAADEALAARLRGGRGRSAARVVLDFGGVDYINSTGIALIVRLLAEARRDHREVIAPAACPTTTGRSSGSPACPTT